VRGCESIGAFGGVPRSRRPDGLSVGADPKTAEVVESHFARHAATATRVARSRTPHATLCATANHNATAFTFAW
jgi:hypothetical protein